MTLTLTAACAPRNSVTLEEYKAQTEELGGTLLATIDDVDREREDAIRSTDGTGELDVNSTWRYWHWSSASVLADDATVTPEQAAQHMAELLEAEGWTADEPTMHDTGGGFDLRRPGPEGSNKWYVGLSFTREQPPEQQLLQVQIVSPSTDARDGTLDAAREFEDIASRVEVLLDDQEKQFQRQRIHYFLGGVPGGKAHWTAALHRWRVAATEVRGFIATVRETTGHPAPPSWPTTNDDQTGA